ncbi:hypothetical protein BN946_scf184989.g47 [Trametes cinnabarina]|uniref:F-box domain-containing protein n=1 Tax=Pycnoporus cinnabarinus TaxID=5643 RepID=A0A060S3P1_PYCCI|nr:hypothetical protein BN946_scf184989.g47 [Trametes cinnabarina]
MLTCNLLNAEAAKEILRRGVSISGEEKILSFLRFMARGSPNGRLPHLRELSIYPDHYGLSLFTASLLAHLLRCMAHLGRLTTLNIGGIERLLASHPALVPTLAHFSIKHLTVGQVGILGQRLLAAMRSQLTTVRVDFLSNDIRFSNRNDEVCPDANPMWLLLHSQHSLHELWISASTSAPNGPRYPNMASLSLITSDTPRISHYIHAFPNLKTLYTDIEKDWEEDSNPQRLLNQREQELYGTWTRLESYDGDTCTLYYLGLKCPINSIKVLDTENQCDPSMLKALLVDARPRDLWLRIQSTDLVFDDVFIEALTQESSQHLRKFYLSILLLRCDMREEVDLDDVLDAVVTDILAALPLLIIFKIRILCDHLAIGLDADVDIDPMRPLEEQLARWDIRAFANRAFKASSSGNLRKVVISVTGHRTRRVYKTAFLRADVVETTDSSDDGGEDSDDE